MASSKMNGMAAVEELPNALRDRRAGRTTVSGVRVSFGDDSAGERAVYIELFLPEPPEGFDTWPVEDLWKLRRMVQRNLADLGTPWYVSFLPEGLEDESDNSEDR
jgi:hypothetical protein